MSNQSLENFDRFRLTHDVYYYEVTRLNLHSLIKATKAVKYDVGLSINFFGQDFESIEFINEFSNLVGVRIIGDSQNLSALTQKKGIKTLFLEKHKKNTVDFEGMLELEEVRADWVPSLGNLFNSVNLKMLGLWGYKPKSKDCLDISRLRNLTTLVITRGNISALDGISNLSKLKNIELNYLRNIHDIGVLGDLHELERLEIESCPNISNLAQVFKLNKLKFLSLINAGRLNSLEKITACAQLKYLNFHKTIIDDGSLSPILTLNNLVDLKLDNKKHHSHKLAELIRTLDI